MHHARQRESGTADDLARALRSHDGAPYPAYRDLRGCYAIGPGLLELLHVQPDPYAPPSTLRISVGWASVCPNEGPDPCLGECGGFVDSRAEDLATEDFVSRRIEEWLERRPEIGSIVRIDPAGQQILRRTAVAIRGGRLEVLLAADLPAHRRRIDGQRAAAALAEGLPRLVDEVLSSDRLDPTALSRHRAAVADHHALQRILTREGWVGFVADGSRLARRAGNDDTPMRGGGVPFVSPPEAAAEVALPSAGVIRGMALPRGILLLCGGAFHGKSTLLRALAAAVYPHIPSDGRELVAVDPSAMGIRAEDGRAVTGVDLSPFLHDLPDGTDPARFETQNASGATSQAAAVIEALSSECRCLLIDEDTSASNFLLRDPWMARLLGPDREPVVPLMARLRAIREQLGASVLLVVGGSGEPFRAADRAIVMDSYRPIDETSRVAQIARDMGPGVPATPVAWLEHRRILRFANRGGGPLRIRALDARRILVGPSEIDLSASGALVHASQGRTLATILAGWFASPPGPFEVPALAREAARRIEIEGPGAFAEHPRGDLAEVRAQEIMMLVDRLRNVTQEERRP